MKQPQSGKEECANSVEPRKPYERPELKQLGTIHQLTQTLPGASPLDNDPQTPGSTF